MAYPTTLPVYDPFTTPITLAALHHTQRHRDMEADILALATKVGINGSADTSSLDYMLSQAFSDISSNITATTAVNTRVNNIKSGTEALTTPTISSFANAAHNHTNAAGGAQLQTGSLPANAISAVLLSVAETTDLFNNTAIASATWVDFKGNQNFTVTTTGSIIVVNIRARAHLASTTAQTDTSSRVIIDSAGIPQTFMFGGSNTSTGGHFVNPFAGSGFVIVSGLAPGVHTIKTQVYSTAAANNVLYSRNATNPNEEFYVTEILELKK